MKTFKEFVNIKQEKKIDGVPTFSQVLEGAGSSCISESMHEKLNEMYESMCNEMKAVHEDETERTAESYCSEAEGKMMEMLKEMKSTCESYMAAMH
jgi:hypothetical protein